MRIAVRGLIAMLLLAALAAGARAQTPADSAWSAGDMERARQLYALRLDRDSSDVRALHRLALIHGWSGAYDLSLALFDRLLGLSPDDLEARVDRARVVAWSGDLAAASREMERLLEAEPSNLPALDALATFRSWAGDYDAALSLYDRIDDSGADVPGVPYQRARVLGWADRFEAALTVYDSLLAADPDDVRALLGLGQVLAWTDRPDSARAIYDRVLALDPGSAEALVGIGRILRWQGRNAAAKPYVDRALELSPGSTEAREERRWLEASLGPRVAPTLAYEWDSDGNRVLTAYGHGAWHPGPRLELRLDLYRRTATLDDAVEDARGAVGGAVTARVQLAPGWWLSASAGAGDPDVAGVDPAATWTVAVATPPRNPVRATLTVGRELLDATAVLMANRVVYDRAVLGLGSRAGPWSLEGEASVAWFASGATRDENRRLAASVGASRPVASWLRVGPGIRVFGFDQDLASGYFDPDLFALLELPASVSSAAGPLDASLAVAPGLQKIATGGRVEGALRTSGGLAWQPGPGRHVSLGLLHAVNGSSPFAREDADYRYLAVELRARWVF